MRYLSDSGEEPGAGSLAVEADNSALYVHTGNGWRPARVTYGPAFTLPETADVVYVRNEETSA